MIIADLFYGCGGFSKGAEMAGGKVILAVEADPKIAEVYRLNFDHTVQVKTLGDDVDDIVSDLMPHAQSLHLHGSPPCQSLSNANCVTKDTEKGLKLVRYYLDVVHRLEPRSWSMEQVNHPAVKELLKERGLPYTVVNAIDFGVPQHRVRLIAGSRTIVDALNERKGRNPPTALPSDVLVSLQPASRYKLVSGTDNQPVKETRNGKRTTIGTRPMRAGEGGRGCLGGAVSNCLFETRTRIRQRNRTERQKSNARRVRWTAGVPSRLHTRPKEPLQVAYGDWERCSAADRDGDHTSRTC